MHVRRGPTAFAAALALLVSGAPAVTATPAAPDHDDSPSLSTNARSASVTEASSADAESAVREALEGVDSETGLWIVQLEEPSVAAKFGATATAGSAETAHYAERLAEAHADLEGQISSALGRTVSATYTYENVLNAIAIEADAGEAAQLWDLDGVVAVYPDTIREMETDVSHEVINSAAAWDGANAPEVATKGEGVIVAMIDSGVNPDHPSFAATGGDGYTHTNPKGAGVYLGACNTEAGVNCNDKLIGAYTFNGPTAHDLDGHGSHVGSTIAGNVHTAEFTMGTADFEREVSGVAPHANVISYKVCNPGCPSAASVAAVDQAIADGVDVINYSISGSDFPWQDPVDLAFLEAHDFGLSVAASAGNSGPGASTVAKTGPWNLSVAATTHNRVFGNPVSVTGDGAPAELVGLPGFPGDGPAITEVYTGDVVDAETITPGNGNGCSAFPAGSMDGEIALIQRGACTFEIKTTNAQDAGAIAVVLYNNVSGPPTAPGGLTATTIPTVMLTLEHGTALRDYAVANDPVEVSIGTDVVLVEDDNWTDLVAGFSSRGPSQFDMLAPTLAAPGVNILAAYNASGEDPVQYGVISGTSMASPHAAGMAALMREVYPGLTPTEIRSVMASTADYEGLLKEDGSTPADAFDIGSGRIDIEQAGRAGIALDETGANFAAADPAVGGEPSTLNLPAFVETACEGECTWTRTVTSIAQGPASYTAAVEAPEGVTITVSPETFSLEPGAEQEIEVTANVSGSSVGAWEHGRITLETTDQHGDGVDIVAPHFPVAVKTASTEVPTDPPVIEVDPAELASTQPTDTVTDQPLTISNTGGEDLIWEVIDGSVNAPVTLDQSTSQDIVENNTVACSPDSGNTTTANAYLRQFVLADHGVTGDLSVNSVTFGVEVLRDTAQTLTVNIYRKIDPAGSLTYANLELLGTTDELVDPVELGMVTVPVAADVPAGSTLVAEVAAPDLSGTGAFFIGSNSAGQSGPSYIASAGCEMPEPTDLASIGFADVHVVMSVDGETATADSCAAPGDPAWLSLDPTSGTTAPEGSTEVTASFDSAGLAAGDYTTQVCVASNDPVSPVVNVPVTLTVTDAPVDPAVVQRVHGADRYATAAEIAAAFPEGVDTVYIANGTESAEGADALAAGAAGARGALGFIPDETPEGDPAPILLVKNDRIPLATQAALTALAPSQIVIVGGTSSVDAGVQADLEATGADVRRIAGQDRYETAALIAGEYGTADTVYVATGQGDVSGGLALADALTAASVAGNDGVPVLLTRTGSVPQATADVLADLGVASIVVVGGPAAVSDAALVELNAIAPTSRVAGPDRYATAAALTAGYATDGDMLYVASGTSFPDALAGSSLTGSQQAPLLLTRGDHLNSATATEILRLSPQGITIFGGTAAVDADVEAALQALLDQTSTD